MLKHGSNEFKKLPLRAKDIVAASPFYSEDGTIYIGSKITTVFAVDPFNGKVYRNYSTDSTCVNKNVPPLNNKDYLWIGRSDYVVSAVDHESGEQIWNFTVSDITVLIYFIQTPYVPVNVVNKNNVIGYAKNVFKYIFIS